MILLDTHVIVWISERSPRLGRTARRHIESAAKNGEVHVSAISFWEIQLLASANRVGSLRDASIVRTAMLDSGTIEVPIDGEIAVTAAKLQIHPDPSDRMLVATALCRSLALVTADEKILSIRGGAVTIDASL